MSTSHGLGERGAALYASLAPAGTDPARAAIALEAARTADRLDDLDQMIQGKGVMNLMMFRVLNREIDEDYTEMNINVEVQIKPILGEARQQSLALSALLKSLDLAAAAAPAGAQPQPAAQKGAKVSPAAELDRRRAAREADRKKKTQ